MDKKELKKVTTLVFERYGFVKKGKYYYLDLDDVRICSGFNTMYGITYLAFTFSIKALHTEEEWTTQNMFDGYDSSEVHFCFDENARGLQGSQICFEEWTEMYYSSKLEELLHCYFDPFRENALEHIKNCYQIIGLVNKDDIVMLTKKARDFLNV